MTLATIDHTPHTTRLVDTLRQTGRLTDPAWAAAFTAVPRHVFAPAAYHVTSDGQIGQVIDHTHPDYLDAVYSDDAIVTQLAADGRPTSSSTQPGVMATMLTALDVQPGNWVLEIGTGTGYNAALLSHRLGDRQVTTVDIDPRLVDDARQALALAGYRPHLAAADGLAGYPPRAPFDRIIATCSVRRVPAVWLTQCVPGGIIVANLSYGVVPLRVQDDGSASGRFLPEAAAFIEARPADGPPGPSTDQIFTTCRIGQPPTTPADPEVAAALDQPEFEFLWLLTSPQVYSCELLPPGERVRCMVDADTGAWLRIHRHDDGTAAVAESDPGGLWGAITRAYAGWTRAGRPGHDRLGLTVTPDGGHTVWVDTPKNPTHRAG